MFRIALEPISTHPPKRAYPKLTHRVKKRPYRNTNPPTHPLLGIDPLAKRRAQKVPYVQERPLAGHLPILFYDLLCKSIPSLKRFEFTSARIDG